jgi:N-acetyl-anhydromuramyl-L-alanine amidase AmpD
MPKTDVARVQSALVQAGYTTPTDGIWNPQSATALTQFQGNRAIAATNGGIDGSTLSALGLNEQK